MGPSPALIGGIGQYSPNSNIVSDRTHIKNSWIKHIINWEKQSAEQFNLKYLKWLFLKKEKNLFNKNLIYSIKSFPKCRKVVLLFKLFNNIFNFDIKQQATRFQTYRCDLVEESGLSPFQKLNYQKEGLEVLKTWVILSMCLIL